MEQFNLFMLRTFQWKNFQFTIQSYVTCRIRCHFALILHHDQGLTLSGLTHLCPNFTPRWNNLIYLCLEPSNGRTSSSQSRATSLVESVAISYMWQCGCGDQCAHVHAQSHMFTITIENFDYYYHNNNADDNNSQTIVTIARHQY